MSGIKRTIDDLQGRAEAGDEEARATLRGAGLLADGEEAEEAAAAYAGAYQLAPAACVVGAGLALAPTAAAGGEGDEDKCSGCGGPLDLDGYDGKCGNCADKDEDGNNRCTSWQEF